MKIASTLIGIVASLALLSPLKASTISCQGHVQANGITIAYEILGKGDRETILLIGGTGMQLTDWPTEFCEELVCSGYQVVLYDNRDIGLSSKFDAAGFPDFAAVVQVAGWKARAAALHAL
jgi:pimeloyl-ACP methyl ester carboxylesterase